MVDEDEGAPWSDEADGDDKGVVTVPVGEEQEEEQEEEERWRTVRTLTCIVSGLKLTEEEIEEEASLCAKEELRCARVGGAIVMFRVVA